jgi:hypothetical protein
MAISKVAPVFSNIKNSKRTKWIIFSAIVVALLFIVPFPKYTEIMCIQAKDCPSGRWQLGKSLGQQLLNSFNKSQNRQEYNSEINQPGSLETKVQKKGQIRVLVSLAVESPPENWLRDKEKEAAYKQKIYIAQNNLLTKLIGYEVTNVQKFEFTPAISMTINAKALEFLSNQPEVLGIEEDSLSSLQGGN